MARTEMDRGLGLGKTTILIRPGPTSSKSIPQGTQVQLIDSPSSMFKINKHWHKSLIGHILQKK